MVLFLQLVLTFFGAAADKYWTVIETKYKEKEGDSLWTGGN